MGADKIQKSVAKYHDTTSEIGKSHIHDLRYTAMMVGNSIIAWLRRGCGSFCIIDEVLKWSNIIREVTLTRYKVQAIEAQYRTYMKHFYFVEGAGHGCNYRLPNKVDNFKAFGRKTDRVKDTALTVVLEMYFVYQESLLTTDEVTEMNSWHFETQKKEQEAKAKRVKKQQDVAGSDEIDLEELYNRVLKNVNNWKPSLETQDVLATRESELRENHSTCMARFHRWC
jgi:hypothetical protein